MTRLVLGMVLLVATSAEAKRGPFVLEGYPAALKTRIGKYRAEVLKRAREVATASPHSEMKASAYVILATNTWNLGHAVTVAFRGGTPQVRKQVATAASAWTRLGGSVSLNFGAHAGKFREWSKTDTEYAADVRISFDQNGYWSLVGTDGTNPQIIAASEASMNLSNFDKQLPSDWQTVVVHEFGHAFGFEHEHQNPTDGCDGEFMWDDDSGYVVTTDSHKRFIPDAHGRRPGIYRYLGGPFNFWDKATVDANLRELASSSAYDSSTFDKGSIMKYYFPDFMFKSGTNSKCFSGAEPTGLSPLDIQGFRKHYPQALSSIKARYEERLNVMSALAADASTVSELKSGFARRRAEMVSETSALLRPRN